MIKTLNIVNGDACITIMKEAKVKGEFLPWRDFLHEGPVPTNLSIEELSKIRASFITSFGFGTLQTNYLDFFQRNQQLAKYADYDKVILWFEHDLYDQLQLIQVLSWFADKDLKRTKLTLISSNHYLGESSAEQIKKLLNYETPVMQEHFDIAKEAWLAFGQKKPIDFFNLLKKDTAMLPFLKGAIYRMLEEYPNTKCGLSRSEYQALLIISNGIDNRFDIFTKYQSFEERKFMGDIIFWKILDAFEAYGVIENHNEKLSISDLGQQLLKGEVNWVSIKPLQRSIGGVDLTASNLWCWDLQKEEITEYYYSKSINSLLKIK